MRTVIYARYSSNLQNSRSIDDQISVCRERCDTEGWDIVDVFTDYAIGGGAGVDENQRPGMHAMLERVERGDIEQVLADSTSRIARNQGDAHHIRERINFAGARLFTLSDGEVDPFRGAIKGLLDEQQRKDLAHNIRRAQKGRAEKGFSPAGIAYGYRSANQIDDRGRPIRGLREIHPEHAEIVRRIFKEYASGRSARQIAEDLNADKIPPPNGDFWRASGINGGAKRGDGLLRNRLYRGELVIGRTQKVIDPRTRKVRIRPRPESEWQINPVPHLRIVDEDVWQAAQEQRRHLTTGPIHEQKRPRKLLSGLLKCGECGRSYTIKTRDRWACSGEREGGSAICSNSRTITTADIERRVLHGLAERMLHPDVVAEYVREYHNDHARRSRDLASRNAAMQHQLTDAEAKVARLVAAIANGAGDFADIREALASATLERDAIKQDMQELEALPVVALHPQIADQYRKQIADLTAALADPYAQREVAPILRAMIETIILTPKDESGLDIEVHGHLANMISMAKGEPPQSIAKQGTVKVERVRGIEPL